MRTGKSHLVTNSSSSTWMPLSPANRPFHVLSTSGATEVVAVRAVTHRTRSLTTEGGSAGTSLARVRTTTGRWALVRAILLGDGPDARIAVLVEAARPPELAPLIADRYGLTPRERQITELVAQGRSTTQIAARLQLSPYTVQDHLKSIFDKSGTSSRCDLVARVFFDHNPPRLAGPTPAGT